MTYDYGGALDRLVTGPPVHRPPVDVEVVVPLCNAEGRVAACVARMREVLRRQTGSSAIVMIDCGSVDYTADEVAAIPADEVALHLLNCTDGGALQWLGLAAASSSAGALAVTDLQGKPSAVPAALTLLNGPSDLVAVTEGRAPSRDLSLRPALPTWASSELVPGADWPRVDMVCMRPPTAGRLLGSSAAAAGDLREVVRLAIREGLTVDELRRHRRAEPAGRPRPRRQRQVIAGLILDLPGAGRARG